MEPRERFVEAVRDGEVEAAARLLEEYESLREGVNEPWFSFDAPAIVAAAAIGSRAMVDLLLAHGADINAKSGWWAGGFGVLHHDHRELSRYLIERGAEVDPHAAAALGMLDALRAFAREDPEFANRRGPDGQVPLHFASSKAVIDFLLEHGADIDRRDVDHGSTPAQWAANDAEKCGYLVARGAKPDIFMAVMLGDEALVDRLLAEDPGCIDARIGEGEFTSGESDGGHIYDYVIGRTFTPLFLAAHRGHAGIAAKLASLSPLGQRFLLACGTADAERARAMLREHPDLIASLSPQEQGLLADAAWDQRLAAVGLMLEAGFPVDARSQGFTALHRSAMRGNAAMARLLLEHGASLSVPNDYGGNALSSCAWGSLHIRDPRGDYAEVASLLAAAGSPLPAEASGSGPVREVLLRAGVPGTD
ncbi:ankyrin repeat domain-containing protein [Paenibacillus sp. GCM10023250]|uniref:ankyrin repeat domain-containing protein n=1 Tax=Paenibacillus sp. GCM10023250 TaxID=3252648 RepID=UPI00361EA646